MTTFGMNLPWVTCGHDFGPRPIPWQKGPNKPRNWDAVERQLAQDHSEAGLSLTRFWVLAGGVNVPCGIDPREVGTLEPTGYGRRHTLCDAVAPWASRTVRKSRTTTYRAFSQHLPLPSLPPSFLEDFQALLRACHRAKMRAIPSLLSFEWFQPAIERSDGVVKRGRKAFVFGEGMEHLSAFLDATLEPLLEASETWRDAIYAWELINEPGWVVRGGPVQLSPDYGWLPTLRDVDPGQMSRLVQEGVQRITRRGYVATVGFADDRPRWLNAQALNTLRSAAREGRYIHQRHHYPTLTHHRRLPLHETMAIQPCILGEVPTALGGQSVMNARWRDPELRSSERDAQRYLKERLTLIEQRGYPAALLWSARSNDPRKSWETEQRRQVMSFHAERSAGDR